MTGDTRFDNAAGSYDAIVQQAIGASGESVQFFADLKVRLMAAALDGRNPGTILDFGCGIGNTTRSLGRHFSTSAIVGFDLSSESLSIARDATRACGERIRYLSDLRSIPLADDSIQAAFAACVFHHIDPKERERWGRELRRVLAPGASLFLFEHNPFNPLTVRVVRNVPFDEGVALLRPREARRLLDRCGLTTAPPIFYFFFPHRLRALRVLEPVLRRVPVGAQYFVVGRRAT
jgi:ubiquinone/menaquinone biosynthesis C-methylase UbiE